MNPELRDFELTQAWLRYELARNSGKPVQQNCWEKAMDECFDMLEKQCEPLI